MTRKPLSQDGPFLQQQSGESQDAQDDGHSTQHPLMSTPSSHSRNKQIFPITTRKRALYSPSSSTPRPSQRDIINNQHYQHHNSLNYTKNNDIISSLGSSSEHSTKHNNTSHASLSRRSLISPLSQENKENLFDSNTSPHMAAKKLSIKRSAGFLNLSMETSPDKHNKEEAIDIFNNQVTKSFNELNFNSNGDGDELNKDKDDDDNNDYNTTRANTFNTTSSTNLFSTAKKHNHTFATMTPMTNYSSTSPFLNTPATPSLTSQLTQNKKSSATSKLKKLFSSNHSNQSQTQLPELIVSTPFDGKKLSPNSLYNKSLVTQELNSPSDSPSKRSAFRFKSPISSSSNKKNEHISHPPSSSSVTSSHSSSTVPTSSATNSAGSSSNSAVHRGPASAIAATALASNNVDSSSYGFITPASFKSVKPLQTAFNSTGLQSKKTMSSIKHTTKPMPETPCKKQPSSMVDPNGSFINHPGNHNIGNTSTKSGFTGAKSVSSNSSSLIISPARMSSLRVTPRSTNKLVGTSSNNSSSQKKLPRHQRANINTTDLQDCILRFTNEFDDEYGDSSNSSIFKDSTNDHNDSKSHSNSSSQSFVTASPTYHSQNPRNSAQISQTQLHNYQTQKALRNASQSPNSSVLTERDSSKSSRDTPLQSTNIINKIKNYNFGDTNNSSTRNDEQVSTSSDFYDLYDDPMDEDIDLKNIDDQNFEGFSNFLSSANDFPPTPTKLGGNGPSNLTPTKLRHVFNNSIINHNSSTSKSDGEFQIPSFPQPVQRISSFASTSSFTMMGPPNKKQNLNIEVIGNTSPSLSQLDPKTPVDYFSNTNGGTELSLNWQKTSLSQRSTYPDDDINDSTSSIPTPFHSQTTLINEKLSSIDQHLLAQFGSCTLIGSGEFSNVYEIQYESVKYAVKRTKTPLSGPKTRLRKMEEVEILKILQRNSDNDEDDGNNTENADNISIEYENHEYVLNLINYWEYNSYLYIMTDCCENGSLDKFLTESGKISKLDEWRVWKILIEILMGLKFIHKCDILHLDLKPANIFITFEGSLKIGDFGLASKLPLPPFFEREGDREYIAPEVISKQLYDKPADIFSVGLIMVEVAANIILPDNGLSWQKLRSGDLTDAGRLSSSDLTDFYNYNYNDHLNSSSTTSTSAITTTTATTSHNNILSSYINAPMKSASYSSNASDGASNMKLLNSMNLNNNNVAALTQLKQKFKIPTWAPKFLFNGSGTLDKLVHWMIEPDPTLRPSAEEILRSYECQLVDIRRKCGAVVYEGDYGVRPDDNDLALEKEIETAYRIGNKSSNGYSKMNSDSDRTGKIDELLE